MYYDDLFMFMDERIRIIKKIMSYVITTLIACFLTSLLFLFYITWEPNEEVRGQASRHVGAAVNCLLPAPNDAQAKVFWHLSKALELDEQGAVAEIKSYGKMLKKKE
jgi:hypothetical protein